MAEPLEPAGQDERGRAGAPVEPAEDLAERFRLRLLQIKQYAGDPPISGGPL